MKNTIENDDVLFDENEHFMSLFIILAIRLYATSKFSDRNQKSIKNLSIL